MLELKGKYGKADVYTDNIDEKAVSQIINLLNQRAFEGSRIKIMPDCHVGKGCVVGFTGFLKGRIIPNIVGVDIGCGMFVVNLGKREIDYKRLDRFIRENIPHGMNVNKRALKINDKKLKKDIEEIGNKTGGKVDRHMKSIGSLGGGNHFIEICRNKDDEMILVIHSGSRNFGNMVAKYHQDRAIKYCGKKVKEIRKQRDTELKGLTHENDSGEIDRIMNSYKEEIDVYNVPKEYAFLEYEEGESYLKDMEAAQRFAKVNREMIAQNIVKFLGLNYKKLDKFQTVHNYIDFDDGIIRKGAISAEDGERVIIPINMKEGSIMAVGKGNQQWNSSAPHGAGRIYSRGKSKEIFTLEQFEEEMKDVWTSSVSRATLDESPMAYKPMEEIIENIGDTVEITEIIKPVYNFKSPN